MRVVVLLTALAHEQALAQPAEGGDTGLGFSHVAGGPAPCFIADEPANGSPLQIGLVVGTEHPQRHAVGEVLRGGLELVAVAWVERLHCGALVKDASKSALRLVTRIVIGLVQPERRAGQVGDDVAEADLTDRGLARLNRSDDRDDTCLGINQSFQRFLQPW